MQPDFTLSPENAAAVARICARLDGLPLAIELAAARIKLYPPAALLNRLDRRLSTLTSGARDLPARHQTLRAAIAWSHDLLDAVEQQLFARLAVFTGEGWTLEALESICAPGLDGDVFDALESLMSKSLVQQRAGNSEEPRYFLLETIREFALEKLDASGEAETVPNAAPALLAAHGRCRLPAPAKPGTCRPLQRLAADVGNIRAALDFAHQHDALVNEEYQLIGGFAGSGSIKARSSRCSFARSRRWSARAPPFPLGLRAGVHFVRGNAFGNRFEPRAR
ncbi:MAG: hypothetical protein IPK19_27680 [Chloroflexi bacterium]|nr:hypothetical protein [Chloroflexota bacterium]